MTNPSSAPAPKPSRRRIATIAVLCGISLVLAVGIVVTTMFALGNSGAMPCGAMQSVSLTECTEPSPPCEEADCTSPTDPLSPGDDTRSSQAAAEFSVGGCVIWSPDKTPLPIDCTDAVIGDFQIVDEVAHPSGCEDKEQPTIETPDGTAYCLAPYRS